MYLIVGLGNPGEQYENTRHNMGFKAVDALAENIGINVRKLKFHAMIGQGNIDDEKVLLIKPQTYMNLSGNAVYKAADYFKVPNEKIIVIYDDIDLPVGTIRIRKSGGAGTHNGMRSVVNTLGTTDFPRIRIGIGEACGDKTLVDHVIGKISVHDIELLNTAALRAVDAVKDIIRCGIDTAMNKHNKKADFTAHTGSTSEG